MKLKVFRYSGEEKEEKGDGGPFPLPKIRYDTFEIEPEPGMTVLLALSKIQEKFDDSLAFRYSCRGAVCGSCAMLINRIPKLACRTQVEPLLQGEGKIKLRPFPGLEEEIEWNPEQEVLIEPLPNFSLIKDLVVDLDKFFEFYRAIEPTFKPASDPPEKERLMAPEAARELEAYTNCVLCAACVGACPISGRDFDFLGPAALAKLYRFHIDPREEGGEARLLLANDKSGWWGCEFNANCKAVCPKGVRPILGIGKARRKLQKAGKGPEKNE